MHNGQIYIFTGDGKGKTSAALGIMMRGILTGWNVGWISWYKQSSWGISEHNISSLLTSKARKQLTFLPMGEGFYLSSQEKVSVHYAQIHDKHSLDQHKQAARLALQKAIKLINTCDLLILDEICNAISDGLIEESDLINLLQSRGKTHIVLTGRNASNKLIQEADLVSEIKKIKHPFDTGKLAIKGLDF